LSQITNIAVAVPEYPATQSEIRDAFSRRFPLEGRRLAAAMAYFDASGIETRYGVLPLAALTTPRTLTETMRLYAERALALGVEVARACLAGAGTAPEQIDLVVVTSCTGIMLPSLDAFLIDALGLRRDVRRLPITQLGCVAGAAALARAHDHLLGHPRGRVLVVAVELPSLNFQPLDVSVDNLISSALFGDGAAAVLMTGAELEGSAVGPVVRTSGHAIGGHAHAHAQPQPRPITVVGTRCHTIPNSTYALGFDLRDDGFHSVLSKDIPGLLGGVVGELFSQLARQGEATLRDLRAFVLHPGGKRILLALQQALGLTTEDLGPSWDVLRRFGNQSSASVLFVLHEWMNARRPPPGVLGALAAFGPGLTAESVLIRWT
jgi:alkylresorcinol/alkylpyrone synthase